MSNPQVEPTPEIPRLRPSYVGTESESLSDWLDFHRATLQLKCAGLTDEQLKLRAVPTSTLSLLGLVRHLTEVERGWFCEDLDGQPAPPLYYTDDDPDGDFDNLDSHPVAEVWVAYHEAVASARQIWASFASPDNLGRKGGEEPLNVRWVMTHLIEEYARHNGHADLLREAIDGERGE
jgi:Protein of unknown function (DUF664)